jgi:hypothetical protein
MDMKEAAAMTEASGLIDEQGGIELLRCAPATAPIAFAGCRDPMGRSAAQGDREGTVAVALRRVLAGNLGGAPALGDQRACTLHGKEAQDLSDLAGFLRSRDRGALDEGGAGGLGRRQQSLPPGRRQGDRRSRRDRRDDVQAGRSAQAAGRIERALCGALQASYRFFGEVEDGRRRSHSKTKKRPSPDISEKTARKAALDFERERKQREAERRRQLAAEAKKRERRERAVAKAQEALYKADRDHDKQSAAIEAERAAVEQRAATIAELAAAE